MQTDGNNNEQLIQQLENKVQFQQFAYQQQISDLKQEHERSIQKLQQQIYNYQQKIHELEQEVERKGSKINELQEKIDGQTEEQIKKKFQHNLKRLFSWKQ